ncbi:MAG: recombination protein RecA, partial [Chloroflexota bacterium]|nr:recombination protein RecA [Chloroflexota bacterium]
MSAKDDISKAEKAAEKAASEKEQTLDSALAQIEKSYGKGAIMRLGDAPATRNIEVIPTGALTLDVALGIGGLPRGRVIEIFGPESSGKTTLALHVIAQAQKLGGVAAFIDAEHALDPLYAARIGVDTDDLLVSQPDTGEQALEIVDVLVRSQAVDIVVVDSVAALVPKAEIEGEMGDSHVGLQARLMSQALRKLTGAISKSSTSVVFINQLREKIGVMFGNPEVTTGGRALKFYASCRLDVRKIDTIKSGLDVVGSRVKVKVVKNKVAPPFKAAEFDILYNEGISYLGSVIDAGIDAGVVEKQGAWFSYGEERLGQGRENVREFLRNHPDITAQVVSEIKVKTAPAGPPSRPTAAPEVAPEAAPEGGQAEAAAGEPAATNAAAQDMEAPAQEAPNGVGAATTAKGQPTGAGNAATAAPASAR